MNDPEAVKRTNLHKVLWPDAGITKQDLFAYLDAVREPLLEELRARPLTLVRAPDGIDEETFFQKNAPKYTPDWIRTIRLPAPAARREIDYILCDDHATLIWLGNQASVELHVTLARVPDLDHPDAVAFDLDPPEDGFALAVAGARVLRAALDEAGLEAGVKTTGGKGLHVVVPIEPVHTWDEVRRAVDVVASRATALEPDLFTGEFVKEKRSGRVLLDLGRNTLGATLAAAYTTRARPGAPVSFPVTWDDLDHIDPRDFTLRTAAKLLQGPGPAHWHSRMRRPQRLDAVLRP